MLVFQPLAQGLFTQRSDRALHADLVHRPDMSVPQQPVAQPSVVQADQNSATLRKARTARHTGNRLRV